MLHFPIQMQSNTQTEKLLMPEQWRETFRIKKIMEKKSEWILLLEEKKDCVPQGLDIILRGFRNPTEVIDFPFRGRPMYIRFYRRRWQEKEKKEVLSNDYEGMKATKEFGAFLKGLSGQERREFFCAFPDIRHIRKEDFSLVSRCTQWFHRTRSPKDYS